MEQSCSSCFPSAGRICISDGLAGFGFHRACLTLSVGNMSMTIGIIID